MHFSVLMSLYEKEKAEYLHESLRSLFEQTLSANEIIIVYDGQVTKELYKVVDLWAKKLPIKTIQLQKNVGLGQALNEGLKHCKNKYVARMDTDDICHPKRFEEQVKFLEENPDIAILGSYIQEFDGEVGNVISYRKVPITNDEIIKYLPKKNPFNHMTVMFDKDEIIKIGSYKHHHLMEDYNLWLRLLRIGIKAANLPHYLVFVRGGKNMVNRRAGLKYVKSEFFLAKLKYHLGYQSLSLASILFIVRAIPRVLPISILRLIYKLVRKN